MRQRANLHRLVNGDVGSRILIATPTSLSHNNTFPYLHVRAWYLVNGTDMDVIMAGLMQSKLLIHHLVSEAIILLYCIVQPKITTLLYSSITLGNLHFQVTL